MAAADPERRSLLTDSALLIGISLVALVAQLLVSGRYGYFRDEFYYLACGEHLDWGYVDQPPFVALTAFLVRRTLGESLLALRFLPAVCNALVIIFTGLMAREMGGGRFAQALAALAMLIAAEVVIAVGVSREDLISVFQDVEEAAVIVSEYARPFETNIPVYIGRNPKMPLREIWPKTKHFI